MTVFARYLEKYALHSLEKQDKLGSLLADNLCEIDMDAGVVRIGGREYAFQAIGTESYNTLTWLWAWADEQTEMPEELLQGARSLRAWGEREGLGEFTAPSVDLNAADGNALALISTGVCPASCFYRDDYMGGAAFLLLSDRAIDALPPFDLDRLTHNYLELIARYELNHRNALVSYLQTKGLDFEETGNSLTCELGSVETLHAVFDATGRLEQLNGEQI